MNEQQPTSQQARELLEQANQLNAGAKLGASWPQIGFLTSLGAMSAMFIICIYFASEAAGPLLWVPIGTMAVWFLILIAIMVRGNRGTKAGFAQRWYITIGAWAMVWVIAMIGSTVIFPGQLWFSLVAAAAVTAVTGIGAWIEATR